MRLHQFSIVSLFGLYDHTITFPNPESSDKKASVIMLYGHNGIGKTTVLRMIDGMMTLDLTMFRVTKFDHCQLSFSDGARLSVKRHEVNGTLKWLSVNYKEISVRLDPKETGPLKENGVYIVEEEINTALLRKTYKHDRRRVSFEFIDTERLFKHKMFELEKGGARDSSYLTRKLYKGDVIDHRSLSERVKIFISDSQLNSSIYFSGQTELFNKIISSLDEINSKPINGDELMKRIHQLSDFEENSQIIRLNLIMEKWDKLRLSDYVANASTKTHEQRSQTYAIISSYLEMLESKKEEKQLLAERIFTFERALNNLLADKKIKVSAEYGFKIFSANGKDEISELQLSTGEFHLLYLTVLALTTRLVGTVIAIDEPEMSMHIRWQRSLIKTLSMCASNANPLFIFATHSPEIAANYENSLQTSRSGFPEENTTGNN